MGIETEDRARLRIVVDAIAESLIESSDPTFGGWGANQKFPHPDALHFLLVRWAATGHEPYLDVMRRTLRTMAQGAIHDAVEGGFYRFSGRRDWSLPDHEKPLLSNAKRLAAYAEAAQALGDDGFARTAEGIAAWMNAALFDAETGAFCASQECSAEYVGLPSAEKRQQGPVPETDTNIFTDRNAWAAIGLLKAGNALQDEALVERALGVLDFLVAQLVDPSRGAAHYWNGAPNQRGHLADPATLLRALVEAVHMAGESRFVAPAMQLAGWTIERLTGKDGSFLQDVWAVEAAGERPAAEASADTLRSNAVLAEGLLRLSLLTGEADLADRATTALLAFEDSWRPHGFAAASYGRALDLVVHPPIHVRILGNPADPRTEALRREALRPFIASRVVEAVIGASDHPEIPSGPIAQVRRSGDILGETGDPARLSALMTGT